MGIDKDATTATTTEFKLQEVTVGEIVYINKVGSDGWITARIEEEGFSNDQGGKEVSLCMYTELMGVGIENERYYFIINEGEYAGLAASMKIPNGADTYIGNTPPIEGLALIEARYHSRDKNWHSDIKGTLDQLLATFTTGNGITGMAAVLTNPEFVVRDLQTKEIVQYTAVMPGEYEIAIPDHPHTDAAPYNIDGSAPLHKVWFPIVGKKESYVHLGHYSSGCFTVLTHEIYSKLHDYLIQHRAIGQDGYTRVVGKLRVSPKGG